MAALQFLGQFVFLTVFLTCANTQSYGELRLVQREGEEFTLSHAAAGLLEIFLDDEWGNVCETGFDLVDANVACRQMGYSAAISFKPAFFSTFGVGENGSVWLSDVDCRNPKGLHILSCAHSRVGTEKCDHFSDIVVLCDETPLSRQTDGSLKLTGGEHRSEGFIEIACSDKWSVACGNVGGGDGDTTFDQKEADAVCWQLGYTEASSFEAREYPLTDLNSTITSLPASQLQSVNRTWYSLPPCTEDYHSCTFTCTNADSLLCNINCLAPQQNTSQYGIYVQCNHTIDYGTLRLLAIDGTSAVNSEMDSKEKTDSGLLEIFSEGQWGTVCGAVFGSVEADLACRQLGYFRAESYVHRIESDYRGNDNNIIEEPIAVKSVQCTPEDGELAYCSRPKLPQGVVCSHNEDIILSCTNDAYPIMSGAEQLSNSSWPLPFSKRVLIEISSGVGFGLILCCCCLIVWCTFCCCRRSRNRKRSKRMGRLPFQDTTIELSITGDSAHKKLKESSNEDPDTKEPEVIVLAAMIQDKLKPTPIPCTNPSVPNNLERNGSNRSSPETTESATNDSECEAESNTENEGCQTGSESSIQHRVSEHKPEVVKDKGKQKVAGISMEPILEEESELEGDSSRGATYRQPSTDAASDIPVEVTELQLAQNQGGRLEESLHGDNKSDSQVDEQ